MLNIEVPYWILEELYTMSTMTTMRLPTEDCPHKYRRDDVQNSREE
jgi:hypothetical protein